MKKNRVLTIGIILGILISALSGIVGNLASNTIPDALKPLLRYIWPIFALVTLASIVLAIWQARQQETTIQETVEPPNLSPAQVAQNRRRFLAKVHAIWIKGGLEKSLHRAALIALGLHERSNAVANPWNLALQETEQSERALPSGTRITQVYDDAIGELLILGEPGSGKSTLLLELARDLLGRAEKDSSLPMPVVFNLSSWATKQQPLVEWLVDEMNIKYQIPRQLAQSWIANDQILLLLDGLDEVKKEYRPTCVGAINTYRSQHGLVSMVVCSRKTEYLDLTTRVLLQDAVVIQPLTITQIDMYLSSARGYLEAIRVVLREDQILQELATTPLMLSVLALTYYGKTVEELAISGSRETRQRHIFETYVEHMLQRRGYGRHYAHERIKHWLSWLAWQLVQQNQTEFYIERLNAGWLSSNLANRLDKCFNIFSAFVLISVIGLIGGLIADHVKKSPIYGIIGSIAAAITFGLFFLIFGVIEDSTVEACDWSWEKILWGLVKGLCFGTFLAFMLAPVTGVFTGLLVEAFGLIFPRDTQRD
jgi:NACHT domain